MKHRTSADNRADRVLDAIDASIALLDSKGFIVFTNKGWRDFAANNPLSDGSPPQQIEIGANYLNACAAATGASSENAMLVYEGIRAVLDGRKRRFSHEYPCHSPNKLRWFLMTVKPLPHSNPREAVVTHVDITDRYIAEINALNKQQELKEAFQQMQDVAEKIKVSLGGAQLSLSSSLQMNPPMPPLGNSDLLRGLSKREMDILLGLVRGERNSAMAARLKLSSKSVSTYRSRVFEKLKVDSIAQLVSLISRTGVLM